MLPIFFGTNAFLASGAVIVSGYTAFDIFIWVAFSHIAHRKSKSPIRTVVVIRFVTNIATALGLTCGILLVGLDDKMNPFALQETTLVGYLIVIAIVMLLSGEESSSLLKSTRPDPTSAVGILGGNRRNPDRKNERLVYKPWLHLPRERRRRAPSAGPHPAVDSRSAWHFRKHRRNPRATYISKNRCTRPSAIP